MQKSITDYTQDYITELIPSHFVKLHILKIFTQHELIMTQQWHSINVWQGKKCYFSMPEPEIRMSLQFFGHYIRQRSVLPPQHLLLPIMCYTVIYTKKANCIGTNFPFEKQTSKHF